VDVVSEWADIRQIAARCGCEAVELGELHDGAWFARVVCPTHGSRVQLLANLAEHDASTDPRVRRLAEEIVATCGAVEVHEMAAALLAYVQRRVRHTAELVETFSPTWRTLEIGIGDCDDSARALVALAMSLGLPVAMQTLPERQTGRDPYHVSAVFFLDGSWRWADASLAAQLGEHPMDAAKRLERRT